MKRELDAQLIADFKKAAEVIVETTGFAPNREGLIAAEAFFNEERDAIAALSELRFKELVLSLGAFLAEALLATYDAQWIRHKGQYGVHIRNQIALPFSKAHKFLKDTEGRESLSSLFDLQDKQAEHHNE